jgi:steroid delta-isomerase-like uncharacterized protein
VTELGYDEEYMPWLCASILRWLAAPHILVCLSHSVAAQKSLDIPIANAGECMAISDLERMLDDWGMAWSSNDPERVLALFADDCFFEDLTLGVAAQGKEELRSFVNIAFAAVPVFTYGLVSRFVASEWASIEWVMSGTHKGDLPGMPATGRRFLSVRGSTILELEAGKIRRASDYWDAATFMKQVGLLPSQ